MANLFCPTFDTHNQVNGLEVYYGKNCVNGQYTGYSSMSLAPGLPCNPNVVCGATSCVATFTDAIANGLTLTRDLNFVSNAQPKKRHKHEEANEARGGGFSTRIAMSTTVAFPQDLGDPSSDLVYVKLTQLHVDEMSTGLGLIALGWEIIEQSHQFTVNPSQVTVIQPDGNGKSHTVAIQVGGVVYSVGTHTAIKKA